MKIADIHQLAAVQHDENVVAAHQAEENEQGASLLPMDSELLAGTAEGSLTFADWRQQRYGVAWEQMVRLNDQQAILSQTLDLRFDVSLSLIVICYWL